jgi:hypothetical protein
MNRRTIITETELWMQKKEEGKAFRGNAHCASQEERSLHWSISPTLSLPRMPHSQSTPSRGSVNVT